MRSKFSQRIPSAMHQCSKRPYAITSLCLSKVSIQDLAKGMSAPEYAQISNLDMNWFEYAKHAFLSRQVNSGIGESRTVDAAAKERLIVAQREAALRGLPSSIGLKAKSKFTTSPVSSSDDLAQYHSVKDTLQAADTHNATSRYIRNRTSAIPQPEASSAHPLGSQLEAEVSIPATPSLSIAESYNSDTIITPAEIRTMFKESVQARTVANTALRKYITTLSSSDYALAVAAYDGCREGGLRIESETFAALLDMLLAAQQLRAGMELYMAMIRDRNPPNTHTYNALMRLCIDRGANDTALKLYDEMPLKGRAYDRLSYELAMTAISLQPHPVDWQKAVQIFERATSGAVDSDGNSFETNEQTPIVEGAEASASASGVTSRRGRKRDLLDSAPPDSDAAPLEYVAPAGAMPTVGGFTGGRHAHSNMATASTYNALMKVYMAMQPFEWRVVYNCYFEMRNSKPKVPITWESYRLVAEAMRRGEASRIRRVITYIDAWIQLTSIGSARFMAGFITYATIIGIGKLVLGYFFTDKLEKSKDVGTNVVQEFPVGHETIAVGLGNGTMRAKIEQ